MHGLSNLRELARGDSGPPLHGGDTESLPTRDSSLSIATVDARDRAASAAVFMRSSQSTREREALRASASALSPLRGSHQATAMRMAGPLAPRAGRTSYACSRGSKHRQHKPQRRRLSGDSASRASGESVPEPFSGMPAGRAGAQRARCPVSRPCKASNAYGRNVLDLRLD